MLFVIHASDKAGHRDVRRAHTEAHVAYLKAQPLKICLAGPLLAEDGETPIGSLLIIEAENDKQARAFSENDPYTKAELFAEVRVTPWRKTLGWAD